MEEKEKNMDNYQAFRKAYPEFIYEGFKVWETEEELDLDYCKESHSGEFAYALSNSLGFGGHNASILLGMRP